MTESIFNAMYLAEMNNRHAATTPQQNENILREFADCVRTGFSRGIGIEEAFDTFTECHATQLTRNDIVSLSSCAFDWLTESFSLFVADHDADDDLEDVFGEFTGRHQLSEHAQRDLANYIDKLADQDDDDDYDDDDAGGIFPDETGKLDADQHQRKIVRFLRAVADAIGDRRQPLFPNLKLGNRPDPYGNRAVGDVKTFDRVANRFGHPADPDVEKHKIQERRQLSPRQLSEQHIRQVVHALNAHDRLWTSQTCNESSIASVKKTTGLT